MNNIKEATLLDYIFQNKFLYDEDEKSYKINIEKSGFIYQNELNILGKKIMYKASLYKEEALYILLDSTNINNLDLSKIKNFIIKYDKEKQHNEEYNNIIDNDIESNYINKVDNIKDNKIIEGIFMPLIDNVKKFYYDVSLKKLNFTVKEHKQVDFNTIRKKEKSLYAYLLFGKLILDDENKIDFILFIPIKLLRFLLFFLCGKDITKLKDANSVIKLTEELELEFLTAKSFFPFRTGEFFNELNDTDFQKTISLFFSTNTISYDMLYALSRVIENGTERIMSSLSKRLKDEYIQNVQEKAESYDKRWIEVSNYHLLCNLKMLLEKKRFESPILSKFKDIVKKIDLRVTEKIFNRKTFYKWMKEALKNKLLHKVFSSVSLKEAALSIVSEPDDIIDIFRNGISSRSYQDLLSDLDYIKRINPSIREQVEAKQEMVYKYTEFIYDNLPEEKKQLKYWIGFKTPRDLNQAYNYIGPVLFSLGVMDLEEKERRYIIKYLNTPAKYFVEDLISGKIKLNFFYGKQTIEKSSQDLAKELHKLNFVGRITLKEMENANK